MCRDEPTPPAPTPPAPPRQTSLGLAIKTVTLGNGLRVVVGSRYAPAELVRYCEESETGDTAELACIARWR